MLLSMTGFGKATAEINSKKITVEIKSLNSKQMDISMRIPSVLRTMELDLRNLVASRLQRGKTDVTLSVESINPAEATATLNYDAIASYKAQVEDIARKLGVDTPLDWMPTLLRMPDVFRTVVEEELSDEMQQGVAALVNEAIDSLNEHRRAEGKKLEEFFADCIANIGTLLEKVAPFEVERTEHIRRRLQEGLAKIPQVEYDKGRLEQEMIFYIEKLDINEERQRLSQHLRYFGETVGAEAGQGKKLGFIAQEMGREINTLGSKSNHAEMQRLVVMMKDILEQIKEQVLNVL